MSEKTKPVKRPSGLMDLHLRLTTEGNPPSVEAMITFADAIVRSCDAPASEMRRRVFAAVEALRDA